MIQTQIDLNMALIYILIFMQSKVPFPFTINQFIWTVILQ